MAHIRWFKDLSKNDIPIVGGKGANLGEMFNNSLPIPDGFCITAQAYEEFIKSTGLKKKITEILEKLDVEDTEALQKASDQIQKLILAEKLLPALNKEITDAYSKLGGFVAVRSSATAEDLPTASFAGQQATYLNIKGDNNLLEAVQKCWASLFTARAIYYRNRNNFEHMKVFIAVVIQKMVNSDKAGVMFSINPVTNNTGEIIIEGSYGLGESVVGGEVNPDSYIIEKATGDMVSENIAKKEWGYFKDSSGNTIKKDIEPSRQEQKLLNEKELKTLLNLAITVEKHYNFPQDMEWAIKGSDIFLTQARPVTTFKPQEKKTPPKPKPKRLNLGGGFF